MRRKVTKPGFAATVAAPFAFVDDPACSAGKGEPCGLCHWCLRAKHGEFYWLKGVAVTKPGGAL